MPKSLRRCWARDRLWAAREDLRHSSRGCRPLQPCGVHRRSREKIIDNPDEKHISTSLAERNNLNIRMHSRRMTRLTNAFSKKIAYHAHAMALHFLYYNFVRVHKTLRTTPAMAAGVTKRHWVMNDVVDVLEAWESTELANGSNPKRK